VSVFLFTFFEQKTSLRLRNNCVNASRLLIILAGKIEHEKLSFEEMRMHGYRLVLENYKFVLRNCMLPSFFWFVDQTIKLV